MAILSHNTLPIKERNDLDNLNNDTFECIFTEIQGPHNNSTIIGSIYRPPNTKPKEFNNQYKELMKTLAKEKNKEIILGMDHNLDLLKSSSHSETQEFIDTNFDNNILPCITRPTRITKSTATLIDNVFISHKLHKNFESSILISDISDHLPSIVNIHSHTTDTVEPWEFNCRSLNENNMKEINNLLLSTDWATLNTKDVNISFTELQNRIDYYMNAITPLKTVIIPSHKAWCEPWITKGLSKSMNKCTLLYKKSLRSDATSSAEAKYKNYRNCLTKIKCKARMDYYTSKCYALKSNMKKLWQLINNVINKSNDKTSIIEYITVNNVQYYDAKEVSNQFGIYYSELGKKLSQKLDTGKVSISKYLKKLKLILNHCSWK